MPELPLLRLLAAMAPALLLGGMAFFSFVFAPVAFRTLPEATAGELVRAVFPVYYAAGFALAVIGAGAATAAAPVEAALLALVALGFVVARLLLMPAMDARRAGRRAGEAAATRAFRRLHAASMILNLAQMAAVAVALARILLRT